MQKKINKIFDRVWSVKHWHNISNYCNRKTHPIVVGLYSTGYRRYRRGKNRCLYCGAKIGKIKCVRKTYNEQLVDNIFTETPIMKLLKCRKQ